MKNRRGNVILESAMFIPVILLLLVGMVQIAKFTYTYYTLRKTVDSIAGYLSSQQGVNFCNSADPTIAQGVSFGLTGTTDNSAPVNVTGLDPTMVTITGLHADSTGGVTTFTPCDCATYCDISQGQLPPDFITVSITGYTLTPRIPGVAQLALPLAPQIKVPYGGT
jgi:hypothetical protein